MSHSIQEKLLFGVEQSRNSFITLWQEQKHNTGKGHGDRRTFNPVLETEIVCGDVLRAQKDLGMWGRIGFAWLLEAYERYKQLLKSILHCIKSNRFDAFLFKSRCLWSITEENRSNFAVSTRVFYCFILKRLSVITQSLVQPLCFWLLFCSEISSKLCASLGLKSVMFSFIYVSEANII